MGIFKDQGYTLITADTELDLSSATNPKILYKDPLGNTGFFTATISGTTLTYQCANADLDTHGKWQFQAFVQIGGLNAYGKIFFEYIKDHL